jgi:hypothetical protein
VLTVGVEGLARVAIPHWLRAEGETVGVYDAIRKSVASFQLANGFMRLSVENKSFKR